ncbi:hypothetical protein FC16_GL000511 [Loigolactobacillus coryniformis subsp. torquens DSM 20004 = KCTC 3535]|nr:hypothetical protein FC16_GL000511 [Loigolactobacillus coryniformis subsp. torquens DSM 20004 = KCTC 3535]
MGGAAVFYYLVFYCGTIIVALYVRKSSGSDYIAILKSNPNFSEKVVPLFLNMW